MTGVLSTIAVIAKEPVAGSVKTRLIGPVSPEGAAQLALAALRDTVTAASRVPCRQRVLVLDGQPGRWLPDDWTVVQQCSGTLDVRLAHAFAGFSPGPALLIGMDTPQLRPQHLEVDVSSHDAWFGPAADGGFWAIGFADPGVGVAVITDVPMSTAQTGRVQLERMKRAGLRVQLLPTLTDVDTPSEAAEVARRFGHTRFAQTWLTLAGR
jgi:glycosyltransferase A (GT-A) superfamily protein (DUF2064 family)